MARRGKIRRSCVLLSALALAVQPMSQPFAQTADDSNLGSNPDLGPTDSVTSPPIIMPENADEDDLTIIINEEGQIINTSIGHGPEGGLRIENSGLMSFGSFGGITFGSGDTIITNNATGVITSPGLGETGTGNRGTTIFGASTIDDSESIPLIDNFGRITGGGRSSSAAGLGATILIEGEANIINRSGALIGEAAQGNIAIILKEGVIHNQAGALINGFVLFNGEDGEDQVLANAGTISGGIEMTGTAFLYGDLMGGAHTGTIMTTGRAIDLQGPLGADFVNEGTVVSTNIAAMRVQVPNGFSIINRGRIEGTPGDGDGFAILFDTILNDNPLAGIGNSVVNEGDGTLIGGIRFDFFDVENGSGSLVNAGMITKGVLGDPISTSASAAEDAILFDSGVNLDNTGTIQAERDVLRAIFTEGTIDVDNDGVIEAGGTVISITDDAPERNSIVDLFNEENGVIRAGLAVVGTGRGGTGVADTDLRLVNHGEILSDLDGFRVDRSGRKCLDPQHRYD